MFSYPPIARPADAAVSHDVPMFAVVLDAVPRVQQAVVLAYLNDLRKLLCAISIITSLPPATRNIISRHKNHLMAILIIAYIEVDVADTFDFEKILFQRNNPVKDAELLRLTLGLFIVHFYLLSHFQIRKSVTVIVSLPSFSLWISQWSNPYSFLRMVSRALPMRLLYFAIPLSLAYCCMRSAGV